MLTVEGIFTNGSVQLLESVEAAESSKVLITFVEESDVDLRELGISEADAAEMRFRFASFEDWNDPIMDIYNDYDNAKAALK